jgi:hypothetical protein
VAARAWRDGGGRGAEGDQARTELSRGGRRKNDALDAAAAGSVAALHGDAAPVAIEGTATVLGMLDERRANLTQQRTRMVNQLYALLREGLPGGASTDLTAQQAAATVGAGSAGIAGGANPQGTRL